MCKWGTDTILLVKITADISHTGEEFWAYRGIDSCIAPIVKALNDAGITTIQSCCGHGKGDGRIDLEDGRVLIVKPSNKGL